MAGVGGQAAERAREADRGQIRKSLAWEAVSRDPEPGLLTPWSFFIIVLDYVLRLLYEKEKNIQNYSFV